MASSKILVALAIYTIAFPSTLATDWVVGDSAGWGLNVDYAAWALGKEFFVGDTLVFNYAVGQHNVVKVNGADYLACTQPANAVPLTSGKDVIPLQSAGTKWYICSIPTHCEQGMKLAIVVLPSLSPSGSSATSPASSGVMAPPPSAAAPSPSAATTGIVLTKFHALIVGVFSILMIMIMV